MRKLFDIIARKFRLTDGFGLQITEPILQHSAHLIEYAIPHTRFELENGRWAEVYTFVPEIGFGCCPTVAFFG